MVLKPYFGFVL